LGSCENGIKILDSVKAKNLLIKTATVRLYRRFILQGGSRVNNIFTKGMYRWKKKWNAASDGTACI